MALIPIAEETADPDSYGFRPKRSVADAIGQCFCSLAGKFAPQWVLEGDISSCFDKINHDWLMNNIPMDKGILQKWLKAGYIDRRKLFPTQEGTPQGGIASPTLANMALDGLERELKNRFRCRTSKVNLIRYADDFVVTGASKELLDLEVLPVIKVFLRERGLELSKEKTKIVHIREGFDFLGMNIRKYGQKLLIKPARKNVQSFLTKIRDFLKKDAAAYPQERVNQVLNPIIRGWSNFHRHIVAKRTFGGVDNQIWEMLWQWVRRRHPNKTVSWCKNRYFQRVGTREWVFAPPEGKTRLVKASDTPIRRHIKIRKDANPFDPEWTEYFEKRERLKKENKGIISPLDYVQEAAISPYRQSAGSTRKSRTFGKA